MRLQVDDVVTLPGYAPYPRYGRVLAREDGDHVRVTEVHCGDPRCASEHRHVDEVWRVTDLEAAQAYQARASWEAGRKGSPNAPVLS